MTVLAPVALVCGAAIGYGQSLSMAWVVDRTSPTQRSTARGLRLAATRLAGLSSPLLLGAIAIGPGLPATFFAAALTSLPCPTGEDAIEP